MEPLTKTCYNRGALCPLFVSTLDEVQRKLNELGYQDEELEVVVGGTSVYEIEGAGTKWSPIKGTRKYSPDAFIIIRKPHTVVSSENHSVTPHHETNNPE